MSEEFPHVRHGLALSSVLAVPAMSVEEYEVGISGFPVLFFDSEDTLHGGVFSAHRAGILLRDPYPPLSLLLRPADGLLRPPFYRQRNSFVAHNLEAGNSASVRV